MSNMSNQTPKQNTNSNSNNNINRVSSNPLNLSSTTFQRRGVRRRWENIRRSNQSVENVSRGNNNVINNNNKNNIRNNIGQNSDLNLVNINSNNIGGRNSVGPINNINVSNEINSNNNIIQNSTNSTNYNVVNNFNNYDLKGNSINADSCFVQFRRMRKNYIDKQNFINNNTNSNNNQINNNNNNINVNNNNINRINNVQANNANNNINQINNFQTNNINNNINRINNIQVNNANNNINQINNFQTNINNNNNINQTNNFQTNVINNNMNNFNNNVIKIINSNESSRNNAINNNNNLIINNSINNKKVNTEEKKETEKKEEPKKEDNQKEISKEEAIGSEIKDTVKCYICFEKIFKPKMCPHCHRMACEKCLYNWFINLKKDKCGFCRANTNYNEMISVPFMDVVVNFVEKFFNNKKIEINDLSNDIQEYCPEHENELLYYYCLDCGKAYCKTCFVFFGEEKDKHNDHSIIEYEKYKNMSFPLLKKNLDKLESNIQHVQENIKRCISYKNCYEHQRKVGNEFINNLQDAFNNQMDIIISSIDEHIKKLNNYMNEYNKYKKDIDEFYNILKNKKQNNHPDKSCESLIIKLTNINQHKFFSAKEIEKLSDLSKNFYVNSYQSKIGEFNHENIFLSRGLKMGTSNCELVIDNKQRDEIIVSLNIPKNKFHGEHNFKGMIFIRKKGECLQSYDLDECSEDYNFYYLKKKIPWDYVGSSIFKLKGILYDFYFS